MNLFVVLGSTHGGNEKGPLGGLDSIPIYWFNLMQGYLASRIRGSKN